MGLGGGDGGRGGTSVDLKCHFCCFGCSYSRRDNGRNSKCNACCSIL